MDIEKLIEQLNDWNENLISELCADDKLTCDDLCDGKDCIVVRAATFLSALQAENKRLKSLLSEGGQDLWSKENQRADRLESENEKLRAENIRWGQVASEQDKQLDRLLAELGQVKHQRDSYRLYHDDLASKPNCNTCADKDCKYRPIPGDTVRANCPLWRGPEEG